MFTLFLCYFFFSSECVCAVHGSFTSEYVYAVFMSFFSSECVYSVYGTFTSEYVYAVLCYFFSSECVCVGFFLVLSRANMFTLFYVIFLKRMCLRCLWYFHERMCFRCVYAVYGTFTSEYVFAVYVIFFFSSERAYAVYDTFTSKYVYYVFCFSFSSGCVYAGLYVAFLLANMFPLFMAPYNLYAVMVLLYQRANMFMLLYVELLPANMFCAVICYFCKRIWLRWFMEFVLKLLCLCGYMKFLPTHMFTLLCVSTVGVIMFLARSGFTRSVFIFCLSCVWLNQIGVAVMAATYSNNYASRGFNTTRCYNCRKTGHRIFNCAALNRGVGVAACVIWCFLIV